MSDKVTVTMSKEAKTYLLDRAQEWFAPQADEIVAALRNAKPVGERWEPVSPLIPVRKGGLEGEIVDYMAWHHHDDNGIAVVNDDLNEQETTETLLYLIDGGATIHVGAPYFGCAINVHLPANVRLCRRVTP